MFSCKRKKKTPLSYDKKHLSRAFIWIPEINKSQIEILEILEELLLIREELAMSKTLSTFLGETETVSPEEF